MLHDASNPRQGLNILPGAPVMLPGVTPPPVRVDTCECGARLSRYNPGGVCGPCERKRRELLCKR